MSNAGLDQFWAQAGHQQQQGLDIVEIVRHVVPVILGGIAGAQQSSSQQSLASQQNNAFGNFGNQAPWNLGQSNNAQQHGNNQQGLYQQGGNQQQLGQLIQAIVETVYSASQRQNGIQNQGSQNLGSQNLGSQNLGSQNLGSQNLGSQNLGLQNLGLQNSGYQQNSNANWNHNPNAQQSNNQQQPQQQLNQLIPAIVQAVAGALSSAQQSGAQNSSSQFFGSQESGPQNYGAHQFSNGLALDSFSIAQQGLGQYGSIGQQNPWLQNFSQQNLGQQNAGQQNNNGLQGQGQGQELNALIRTIVPAIIAAEAARNRNHLAQQGGYQGLNSLQSNNGSGNGFGGGQNVYDQQQQQLQGVDLSLLIKAIVPDITKAVVPIVLSSMSAPQQQQSRHIN